MTEQENNFLTKKRFTKIVEDTVRDTRMSYMDSIIHVCEQNMIELDDVKKYLSTPIIERLEAEAMSLNFLPRGNTLDV